MGIYNSSEHRVKPLMKCIENNEEKFKRFVLKTIGQDLQKPEKDSFWYTDSNKGEKGLKPTKEQLKGLVEHLYGSGMSANGKREKLFRGNDEGVKLQALNIIELNYDNLPARAWYIFEGYTFPDVFIEGNDYIIICEGKWTERNITNETTYLNRKNKGCRNQMVRHIQGALNYIKQNALDKRVFAFYIVDEEISKVNGYYDELSVEKFIEQVDNETISIKDAQEKEKIISAYREPITWQELQKDLGINFQSKESVKKESSKNVPK